MAKTLYRTFAFVPLYEEEDIHIIEHQWAATSCTDIAVQLQLQGYSSAQYQICVGTDFQIGQTSAVGVFVRKDKE